MSRQRRKVHEHFLRLFFDFISLQDLVYNPMVLADMSQAPNRKASTMKEPKKILKKKNSEEDEERKHLLFSFCTLNPVRTARIAKPGAAPFNLPALYITSAKNSHSQFPTQSAANYAKRINISFS